MPRYLDTRGQPTLAIGICDRCRVKHPLGALSADANVPGLLVCPGCSDVFDPYRLPPRRVEDISLPEMRPDTPLIVPSE